MLCVLAMLASCDLFNRSGDGKEEEIEFYPFQNEPSGRWGMVSPEGKVLFNEEFVNQPTYAVNGRFMVKNKEGLWEIYTAEEKPRMIGRAYATAGLFVEEVAPVAAPDGPIEFIDRNGKTMVTLDKVHGHRVKGIRNFSEGLAVFSCSDSLQGAVDTKGDVKVEPNYVVLFDCHDGKLMGVHKKYKQDVMNGDTTRYTIDVLDKNGKKLFEMARSEFAQMTAGFNHGHLGVGLNDSDGNLHWGILNDRKEWTLQPSAEVKEVQGLRGDKFIYSDGTSFGVMNLEGEMLIHAKYDGLSWASDDELWATSDGGSTFFLIDLKGEKVGDAEYMDAHRFVADKPAPVEVSDNNWILLGKDGKPVDKKSYAAIGWESPDEVIENNKVDVEDMLTQLGVNADGMDGITFDTRLGDVLPRINPDTYDDPSAYIFFPTVYYHKEVDDIDVTLAIAYDGPLTYTPDGSTPTLDAERRPVAFKVEFTCENRLEGKQDMVYQAMCRLVKKLGTAPEEEAKGYLSYRRGDDGYISALRGSDGACRLFIVRTGVNIVRDDWDPYSYPTPYEKHGDTPDSQPESNSDDAECDA